MPRKKLADKDKQKFKNIGLLLEDHALLLELSKREQRSMTRQLSVLIRGALTASSENASL
jgi:hypothetical protein